MTVGFDSRDDALAFCESSLDIDPRAPDAEDEFEFLLAHWPRDWDPLSEEQVTDIRRALRNVSLEDQPMTATTTASTVVSRKEFLAALRAIAPAIPKKSALPTLQHVRVQATPGGETLMLTATDLTVAIGRRVSCQSTVALDVLTPFAMLKSVVTQARAEIAIARDDAGKLIVDYATLPTLSPDDFPTLPPEPADALEIVVDGAAFSAAVGRVLPCRATDRIRPVLGSVCLRRRPGDQMDLVAADGFRLARATLPFTDERGYARFDAMLADTGALAIGPQKLRGPVTLRLASPLEARNVWLHHAEGFILFRTETGQFPDYAQIIPDVLQMARPSAVTVGAAALGAAAKQAGVVAKLNNDVCWLVVTAHDGLVVTAHDGEEPPTRRARAAVPGAATTDAPFRVGLNWTFVRDACAAAAGQTLVITMDLAKPMGPVRFDAGDLTMVLMPMVMTER